MLSTVLACCTLGLAYAANNDYNYPEPSVEFIESVSFTLCATGYSGQYPNCVPSYSSVPQSGSTSFDQNPNYPLMPQAPTSQCPPGSFGQIPFCKRTQPAPTPQCPSGSFGKVPYCQRIPPPNSYLPPSPGASRETAPTVPIEATAPITKGCTGTDCTDSGDGEEGFGGPKTDSEVSFQVLKSAVG